MEDNPVPETPLRLFDQLSTFAQEIYDYLSPKHQYTYPVIFTPATTALLFAIFFQILIWSADQFNCGGYLNVCSEALTLLPWGGFIPFLTDTMITEPYRLFTYSLHHWSFEHILTNMTMFVIVSYGLEKRYGSFRILLIYVVSVISSGICFWWFFHGQNEILAGASGGIFGLIGCELAHIILNYRDIKTLIWPVIYLLSGAGGIIIESATSEGKTAIAHICGAVAGVCISLLILPQFHQTRWRWYLTGGASILIFLEFIVLPLCLRYI